MSGSDETVPDPVRRLAEKSGHTFHARVVRELRARGWAVLVSPYYLDSSTDKSREIDLVAQRSWPLANFHGHTERLVVFRLFVECKFFRGRTVVWFDGKDEVQAARLVTTKTPISPRNTSVKDHHYLKEPGCVGKLFETDQAKGEHDPLFKGLDQALKALISLGKFRGLIDDTSWPGVPRTYVDLPVIFCNSFDGFYRVELESGEISSQHENFLVEVEYAFVDLQRKDRREYFLVDIVSIDLLKAFLDALDCDVVAISAPLSLHVSGSHDRDSNRE